MGFQPFIQVKMEKKSVKKDKKNTNIQHKSKKYEKQSLVLAFLAFLHAFFVFNEDFLGVFDNLQIPGAYGEAIF